MRVACPHCSAEYNIDDRRIPAAGVNVKCPKCQAAFPVRRAADGDTGSTAVPLPAPAPPAAARPPQPLPAAAPPPIPPPV
ncbi:MAG TPA: zinc-ribbon domain-containing protein, partial [Anaeromyxobacteraceae bacterium]|nr:zinc-ribbon domain-containing protein [Anaeromyxobacteraceae bacterium]